MDKQLYLMNRYQKDDNTIAYAFSEEIILIKREYAADGTAELFEIIIGAEASKAKSKRRISDSEMKVDEFDAMKKLLTKSTKALHKTDVKISRRDCDLEKLENTEMACLPSVEDEYIEGSERTEVDIQLEPTLETAKMILESAKLTQLQISRYIMYEYDNLSMRDIAAKEGVAQSQINKSIQSAKKKIKNFLENSSKQGVKTPKKCIKVRGKEIGRF